jgi:hypothetical protein
MIPEELVRQAARTDPYPDPQDVDVLVGKATAGIQRARTNRKRARLGGATCLVALLIFGVGVGVGHIGAHGSTRMVTVYAPPKGAGSSGVRPCTASGVEAKGGQETGGISEETVQLTVTNVSHATCSVSAEPPLTATGITGTTQPIRYVPSSSGQPVASIVLEPTESASSYVTSITGCQSDSLTLLNSLSLTLDDETTVTISSWDQPGPCTPESITATPLVPS